MVAPARIDFTGFKEIVIEDATFSYLDELTGQPAFSVGPFRLSVTAGETVFIVGGNGSGKSTLMKLLTGLYAPHRGALLVDGDGTLRDGDAMLYLWATALAQAGAVAWTRGPRAAAAVFAALVTVKVRAARAAPTWTLPKATTPVETAGLAKS